MSSAVNPITSSSSVPESSSATTNAAAIASTDALGNESTFLQLLVAQMKNQDPTAPMDSSTFLTQLAQFSSLEQLIGIRQDVSQLDTNSSTGTGTTTTPTTPTSSGN
jgi:flagellar basal-body rod modification protein FlgD